MQVIPAIDIRDGRCVRLLQGDYAKETVYADDPVAVALRWEQAGAERLHVVDLDGAAGEGPRNLAVVERIVGAIKIPVQLGGGLKALAHVQSAFASGVERVILGTAAVGDQSLVSNLAGEYPERVIVGIDARDGRVAIRGWKETSAVAALDLARQMVELGVRRFVYTDISRDGMLTEPNYEALSSMIAATDRPVIASGGVASIGHLLRLQQVGAEGAVVGRALYTGDVDLAEALRAVREGEERGGAD